VDGELPDPPAWLGALDLGAEPLEPELGAFVTGVEGSDGSCFGTWGTCFVTPVTVLPTWPGSI